MCKIVSTAHSLVWLRRAVRRWRSRAARPDKDTSPDAAAVPAGHVAVRVEGGRFLVPLAHLSHPAFQELLRQAEEEYGFPSGASGPLALPCDEQRLRDVLRRVASEGRRSSRGDSRPLLQGMGMAVQP
jgi:SAUR family protein